MRRFRAFVVDRCRDDPALILAPTDAVMAALLEGGDVPPCREGRVVAPHRRPRPARVRGLRRGRLRPVATIADPRVIARVLAHLGLPLEPPGPMPPRQPSWRSADAN